MKESMEKVIESEKEIMDLYMHQFASFATFDSLDEEETKVFKSLINFMDSVNDCLKDFADTVDEQNKKLDRILEKVES